MDKKISMKLLTTVKKLFEEHEIKFWMMFGTLLGFVRDKDFIEWDYDIDIGAWYSDYEKIIALKEDFIKAGYEMELQKGKYSVITIRTPAPPGKVNEDALARQGEGIELDIIFWIKDKDRTVSVLYKNTNVFAKIFDGLGRALNQDYYFRRATRFSPEIRKRIEHFVTRLPRGLYNFLSEIIHSLHLFTTIKLIMPEMYGKLDHITIKGHEFAIPSNWEQYLELAYGKTWRTPNRDWGAEDEKTIDKSWIKYIIREQSNKTLMRKRWNIE